MHKTKKNDKAFQTVMHYTGNNQCRSTHLKARKSIKNYMQQKYNYPCYIKCTKLQLNDRK